MGLEGVAGAGKTTSLTAIREAAEREGCRVDGLAPTSRAAHQLGEAGIASITLQRHLTHEEPSQSEENRLYILDESSLASTKQVHEFLQRLGSQDRVLMVGDTRQHEAVEAGRPFQQLQEAGMQTARLDEIVRQKDPALKEAVEQLASGHIKDALGNLDRQGRIHEIEDPERRLEEIARQYVTNPGRTLVVSPDNQSRMDLNHRIHSALQGAGKVDKNGHVARVLVPRQELTGADRQWAGQYNPGDVVRYTRGSKVLGIEPGEYARVTNVDQDWNSLTIERASGKEQAYDPRRLSGVTVYREAKRSFNVGDRVQFTAPLQELNVANRHLGAIENIDNAGDVTVRMDSGRAASFNVNEHPHLDYGYAVTSHSSQGQTADRVLIHVDTEAAHEKLINSRMAYVSVSRARYDVQIYTNDKAQLAQDLSRNVSHRTAIEQNRKPGLDSHNSPAPSRRSHTYEQISSQAQGMGR